MPPVLAVTTTPPVPRPEMHKLFFPEIPAIPNVLHLHARNRLLAAVGQFRSPTFLAGLEWQCFAREAFTTQSGVCALGLRLGNAQFSLFIDHMHSLPLPASLEGHDFSSLVPQLRAAILTCQWEQWEQWEALRRELKEVDGEMQPLSEPPFEPDPDHHIGLGFRVSRFQRTLWEGTLYCLPPHGHALAQALEARLTPAHSPFRNLQMAVSRLAGQGSLTQNELRALRFGDVVLVEGPAPPPGEGMVCVADHPLLIWKAKWNASKTVIEERWMEAQFDDEKTGPIDRPIGLDEMTMRVHFELGRSLMTLAEVEKIKPGMVLELPERDPGTADLRVNGTWIGSGTLVRVGERLGLRMDTLGPDSRNGETA